MPTDQPALGFLDALRRNARFCAGRPAIAQGDQVLTWREFDRRTSRIANALLERGLAKGDRVAAVIPNSAALLELLWGTIKAGGAAAPIAVSTQADALCRTVAFTEPRFVFATSAAAALLQPLLDDRRIAGCTYLVDGGNAPPGWLDAGAAIDEADADDPWIDVSPDDSMTIVYTSGSTGTPKGVEHTHRARLTWATLGGAALGIDRNTVTYCSTPLHANGAWGPMLPTVFHGGTFVVAEHFDTGEFLASIEHHRASFTFVVPTQLIMLLADPRHRAARLPSLKTVLSAGAPLARQTKRDFEAAFPHCFLQEMWGFSEGASSYALPGDGDTVGMPLPGNDLRVIGADGEELPDGETGELVGWGTNMMKGYFKDPDRTAKLFWPGPHGRTYLRTGDLGQIDAEGRVHIVGRIKDVIISGGVKINAADLEAVFLAHPDAREVAVVGVSHAKWGETPVAFVLPHEGRTIDCEALKAWGNARVDKNQRVDRVVACAEFPRASQHKVSKPALRAQYEAAAALELDSARTDPLGRSTLPR